MDASTQKCVVFTGRTLAVSGIGGGRMPARRHITKNERRRTQIGNNYRKLVFGLMAFFPIVIRKVRSYVAMHNEINAQQA